jgi:Ribosomal protein L23
MISVIPIAKEKALNASTIGKYMFFAPLDANKNQIAESVAAQFSVTVTDVTTLVRKGKPKRSSRGKRRYPGTTFAKDMKVAYVTLKEGDKIKIFDEEPVADTKTEEKKEAKKTEASVKVEKKPLLARRRTGNRGDK